MANKYAGTADNLRKLAIQFQSVIDAAEALDQIGPLDGQIQTLKDQRGVALAELSKTRSDHEAVKADVAKAKSDADAIRKGAVDEAAAITKDATLLAEKALGDAKAQAEKDLAAARADLSSKIDDLQKAVIVGQKNLDDVRGQLDGASMTLADVRMAKVDADKKLQIVRDAIAAAKA